MEPGGALPVNAVVLAVGDRLVRVVQLVLQVGGGESLFSTLIRGSAMWLPAPVAPMPQPTRL
jgi:hypothetical protein